MHSAIAHWTCLPLISHLWTSWGQKQSVWCAYISQSVWVLKHPKVQHCASSVMARCYHWSSFRRKSAAITCRWQEDSFLCSTPSPRMVGGVGKGRNITTTFFMQQTRVVFSLHNGNKHSIAGEVIKLPAAAYHILSGQAFQSSLFCKWPMTVFFFSSSSKNIKELYSEFVQKVRYRTLQ